LRCLGCLRAQDSQSSSLLSGHKHYTIQKNKT